MMGLGGSGGAVTWVGCAIGFSYYGREVLTGLARGRCQEFGIPFEVVGVGDVVLARRGGGFQTRLRGFSGYFQFL